jgi:glutamate carboxypeptidase
MRVHRSIAATSSAALLSLALLPAPGAASGLSPRERAIADYVDAHADEAIRLLARLVDINSGTQNPAGVRRVGEVLREELDALGFETRWVSGEEVGRTGHLVARHAGKGPGVLLIGHLDTVFEEESPFQRFERVDAETARGPGVIDMKGGDVIALLALRALDATGALAELSIDFFLCGDEEDPGEPVAVSRQALVDLARDDRYALGFEDGDGDVTTAAVSRRGISTWRLETTGIRAHSSQVGRQDLGSGAIYEMARLLTRFHELLGDRVTLNPGVVLGGSTVTFDADASRGTAFGKANVIAERAVAAGDLRTVTLEQRETAKQAMRRAAAQSLPHTTAELTFRDGYPPMDPTGANYRLLDRLDRVSRALGLGALTAVDPGRLGAADVSFAAPLVEGALDGLGMGGDGGHSVHETADLSTFPGQAKRAAVLILRLGSESR